MNILTCVQCSRQYSEFENAEGSCLYHSGKLKEAGTHAYYTCCADRKVTLGMVSEVPGCTQGRHQDHHHIDYPYNAYTEFMNQQSADAKEVWMEMDVQDWGVPGRYEWAEVGLSESNKIYILAGDEEGCTDYVQLGAEDLNQKQEPAAFTALQRSSENCGWMVRAEVQSHNFTTKAVSVTIQPATMAPVEKRVMIHIDGDRLQPGKVELVRGNPSPPRPTKSYTLPPKTYEGPLLELGMDYHDFSTDRKNDYETKSENGCPLTLQQEGYTSVFSRHSTSHEDMWENVFSATVKITNTAEECLTITNVFGEYLNHGNEWVKCDDVLLAKDFFPRMYKWYLRSQNFSLDPGFTDSLTAQLTIRFSGSLPEPLWRCCAHHSLPQPLHFRVTFATQDTRSASLRFEQGNPPAIPTIELREKQWGRQLDFHLFADDVDRCKRADAGIYYDLTTGKTCYRCSVDVVPTSPVNIGPYLHYAALEAKKVGQCEYELAQLREESDLEGGPSIQVLAVVDLDAIVTYGLKVVIRTSTSSATGYYLVPYHDRDEATFTMEAKELSANENFIVRWNVPMSTTEDTIGIYQSYGRTAVTGEVKNRSGLSKGHAELKAPDSLGVYEVRYYSSWLKEQYQPGHHRQCWVVGEVMVTAA